MLPPPTVLMSTVEAAASTDTRDIPPWCGIKRIMHLWQLLLCMDHVANAPAANIQHTCTRALPQLMRFIPPPPLQQENGPSHTYECRCTP